MNDIDRESREDPQLVIDAPHSTRIGRLDEAAAARKPVLRWKPDMEATAKSA
jgi:glycine dehydrogenase subunit 2